MTDGSHTHGVPVLVQVGIGVGSLLLAGLHDIIPILDMYVGFGAKCLSMIGSASLLLINRRKIWESAKSLFIQKQSKGE